MARRDQRGWSLPLTSILLLLAIAAVVVFGWTALIYVAGAALIIGLGGGPYGFATGAEPQVSQVTFWFTATDALPALGEKLLEGFRLGDPSYDGENVWEWFEADNKYYAFNLSHKRAGEERTTYHLEVKSDTLELVDVEQDALGTKLAHVLATDIHCGRLQSQRRNSVTYTVQRVYRDPGEEPDTSTPQPG